MNPIIFMCTKVFKINWNIFVNKVVKIHFFSNKINKNIFYCKKKKQIDFFLLELKYFK